MLIKSLRILRFSYNLLTCGEYDPIVNKAVDDDRLPLGVAGVSLAHNITRLFDEKRTSILIPDDGLLIWNNQRMLHSRAEYSDKKRHLIRYWIS